ncbi:MAG: thioredoxin family protein [Bacteroidetes bacterium]|nr:thioredoxin family protein [Bacteroidota bacterium]MCA6443543.1 thioredoxin family protein [Bacteroidota bacterium]
MKIKKLIPFIFLAHFGFINAQIDFEHGTWASVIEKAKTENKLIFVDVYTTWCGPCKLLSKTTFTNDTVAKFYNQHFINYKLDAEKGEGIEFARKYEVNCYPNLLFINPKGELVHRGAGYKYTSEFIAFGKDAQNDNETFVNKKKLIINSGLNEKNIHDYIRLMDGACLSADQEIATYLKTVKEEDLLNYVNWSLIKNHVNTYNSREINYVIQNYSTFSQKFGEDTLSQKLRDVSINYFKKHLTAKLFNESLFNSDKTKFEELNWPKKAELLFYVNYEIFKRHNLPAYFNLISSNYSKYYNNNAQELNSMAWTIYEKDIENKHGTVAVKMAQRACELEQSYAYLDTYAAVLFKSSNYPEAKIQAEKAITHAKNSGYSDKDYQETTNLLTKINSKLK